MQYQIMTGTVTKLYLFVAYIYTVFKRSIQATIRLSKKSCWVLDFPPAYIHDAIAWLLSVCNPFASLIITINMIDQLNLIYRP
jgi:hypothetical protein